MDDDQVSALEALAERWAETSGGMPLEALDGLFSALVVGPGPTVGPSEYMPLAVGEAHQWRNADEAHEALALLMALWNHIIWRVAQPIPDEADESDEAMEAGFDLMPFVAVPEADDAPEGAVADDASGDPFAGIDPDFPVGALWAAGFLQGVALRSAYWDRWMDDDPDLTHDLGDLASMSMVAPEQAQEAGVDWDDRLTLTERWELLASVPGLLQDLNQTRQEALRTSTPIRRAPVPGRNDPCSCGSGRKYKKCCGGQTLH